MRRAARHLHSAVIASVALLLAAGCRFDSSLPEGAQVTCASDSECTRGYSCSPTRGICLPDVRGEDVEAPVLTGAVSEAVIRPGGTAGLRVSANEPLGVAPRVETQSAVAARVLELVSEEEQTRFDFSFQSAADEPDGPVRFFASAEDLAGNVLPGVSVGVLLIDGTPPRVQSSRVSPARAAPGTTLTISVGLSEAVAAGTTLIARERSSQAERARQTWSEDGDRALRFELPVAPGTPSESWDLTLEGLLDPAGNQADPGWLAEVTIDADPPQVSSPGLSSRRYSTQEDHDEVEVPVAVEQASQIEVCLGSRCQPASDGDTVRFTVTDTDPEGPTTLLIRAVDEVGNRAEKSETVIFDFTPPGVLAFDTQYFPPPDCPFQVVDALAAGATATTSFSVNEALGAAPVVAAQGLGFSARTSAFQSFVYQHVLGSSVASASLTVTAELVDSVGNRATVSLGPLEVDTTPPAPPPDSSRDEFIYRRVPYGSASTNAPWFGVSAAAGTFAAGSHLYFWSGAIPANALLLGSAIAQADGSLGSSRLSPLDLSEIFFTQYDSACNGQAGGAQTVPTVEWTASFGGKIPGNPSPNPHRFLELRSAVQTSQRGVVWREWADQVSRIDSSRATSKGPQGRWVRIGPQKAAPTNYCLLQDAVTGELLTWDKDAGMRWRVTSGWERFEPGPAIPLPGRCVWDPVRQRLVATNGPTTLAWDGLGWNRVTTQVAPPSLEAIAWSPPNQAIVGLHNQAGSMRTWLFDGASWVERLVPGPVPARALAGGGLAADPSTNQVVLFGGVQPGIAPPALLNDAWSWNGSAWSKLLVNPPPPPRVASTFLFDPGSNALMLLGGSGWSDQWQLELKGGWKNVPGYPSGAWVAAAPFDELGKKTVALLGWDWSVSFRQDDGTFKAQPSPAPGYQWLDGGVGPAGAVSARGAVSTSTADDSIVWYTSAPDLSFDQTYLWNGVDFVDASASLAPASPADPAAMTLDPTTGRPLMIGATDAGVASWQWTGTSWQPVSGPQPSAVEKVGLASEAGDVLLFGGRTAALVSDETWLWDGGSWSLLSPGARPTPRTAPAMAFDPSRGRTVLFGGLLNGTTAQADTWEWDGQTWAEVTPAPPAASPTARGGASLVWDANRQVMVLHGGGGLRDTWEWDGQGWSEVTREVGDPADLGRAVYEPDSGTVLLHTDTGAWRLARHGQLAQRVELELGGVLGGTDAGPVSGEITYHSNATGAPRLQVWDGWRWRDLLVGAADAGSLQTLSESLDMAQLAAVADAGVARFQVIPAAAGPSCEIETDYIEATFRYQPP